MTECEEILQKALSQGKSSLLISEARKLCALHNIPTPESGVANELEEAAKIGKQIGYPVALKIVSPQILHKSDVGGVALNINRENELRAAYPQLLSQVSKNKPDAEIFGVLVEKMMPHSTEVIVGGIRDNQFGPSVMFGMGGIYAEVYEDVAFRVAPLDKLDALSLINEIKGSRILKGIRGQPAMDIKCIVEVLLNVSAMMIEHDSIDQLDLNPVIVYTNSACAVDSRVVLRRIEGGV